MLIKCSMRSARRDSVIGASETKLISPTQQREMRRGIWPSSTKPLLKDSTTTNTVCDTRWSSPQQSNGYDTTLACTLCTPVSKAVQFLLARPAMYTTPEETRPRHTQMTCETCDSNERHVPDRRTHARVHDRTESQYTGPAGWHAMSSSRFTPAV
jgi:hypothetical protein